MSRSITHFRCKKTLNNTYLSSNYFGLTKLCNWTVSNFLDPWGWGKPTLTTLIVNIKHFTFRTKYMFPNMFS